ncbi:chaperone modulatory protein CbpM [Aestuariicella hydrocarbonica]|uniref:Chaperone modulatory protein CbpM n=1 Tax=Pseudomaricurvus hydrocarbonicus TaxID=1470433 RepID=A0A9E5MNJ6_9GAMM|nr:chaperone modulator CbpM [Aestuariicella hydrocarbonica]NHO67484.1 chaperone modulatory protein CbpM [Aestuariicella hydrocarbonica]
MTETVFSIPVRELTFNELCQLERIERRVIVDIVEHGIAKPLTGATSSEWVFDTTSVHWIKKAVRLHQDLEIDWVAVSLVIELMQQKESLLRENERYRSQLRRFMD